MLWRDSVDVVNTYNQLALSKADYPPQCGWASSHQSLYLKTKRSSPLEKEILISFKIVASTLEILACRPALRISQLCEPIPYNNSLYMHPVGSVSLKNSDTVPLTLCDTNWHFNSVDFLSKTPNSICIIRRKRSKFQ